jgi:fructosamine-3-kinase
VNKALKCIIIFNDQTKFLVVIYCKLFKKPVLNKIMWNEISEKISKAIDRQFEIKQRRSVSGGCINQGYAISDGNLIYFIKLNQATKVSMFAAEAQGLQEMLATNTIKVPQPICWGTTTNNSYIVMEWLEFGGENTTSWEVMGRNLAKMHKVKVEVGFPHLQFGWGVNNTIGSTPQINTFTDHWADFFAEFRIGYQLKLAQRRGFTIPPVVNQEGDIYAVIDLIREILSHHHPRPSLVHGDLWSGNAAITVNGEPVILDPATYYGDREVDLAMTELFGGFPAAFYRGYHQEWPLDQGYQQRKTLYNLYHILNHFNLFGGGYGNQAHQMMKQIVTQ